MTDKILIHDLQRPIACTRFMSDAGYVLQLLFLRSPWHSATSQPHSSWDWWPKHTWPWRSRQLTQTRVSNGLALPSRHAPGQHRRECLGGLRWPTQQLKNCLLPNIVFLLPPKWTLYSCHPSGLHLSSFYLFIFYLFSLHPYGPLSTVFKCVSTDFGQLKGVPSYPTPSLNRSCGPHSDFRLQTSNPCSDIQTSNPLFHLYHALTLLTHTQFWPLHAHSQLYLCFKFAFHLFSCISRFIPLASVSCIPCVFMYQ